MPIIKNDEEFVVRAHHHGSGQIGEAGASLTVVHMDAVFNQIRNQSHRAIWQQAFKCVRLGIALIVPEGLNEVAQRVAGSMEEASRHTAVRANDYKCRGVA